MPVSGEVIDLCSSSPERKPDISKAFRHAPVIARATSSRTTTATISTKAHPKRHVAKTTAPSAAPDTPENTAAVSSTTSDDFDALLGKLNKAQRCAVTSNCATVAILAGPGSGKTHTLTSRVAWLVDVEGYQPQNVIVTTFTVKAAREMKERIGKVLGDGRERRLVLGTFHSVARRYLSIYGRHIGLPSNFTILDDADSRSILSRIVKRLDLPTDPGMARGWISKKKAGGCLGEEQEAARKKAQRRRWQNQNSSSEADDYTKNLETIYAEYQSHLQSLNLLDYDDLLVKCADLLRAHPRCVANVQAVLVDEFQDTNGIQFELMRLLAQARNRITVVGDPDQSIYGWRSAEVTNLRRFLGIYPGTAEVALEENYRSSQSILTTSLEVIQQDEERYDKSLLPIHKKGVLPVLRRLYDTRAEARWIVTETQRAVTLSGYMLNYSDVAILVRSATLSRPIEQALGRAGIPYRMIGGHKFFDRAEIKVLLDYLRVVLQPHNNDTVLRIINVPRRGVGAKTCQMMLEEAETTKISLWTLIGQHLSGKKTIDELQRSEYKVRDEFVALIRDLQRRVARATGPVATDTDPDTAADTVKDTTGGATGDGAAGASQAVPPLSLVGLIETLIERLQYREYIYQTYGEQEAKRWSNVQELVALTGEFEREHQAEDDALPEVAGQQQAKDTNILAKFLANIALSANVEKKNKKVLSPAEEKRREELEAKRRQQKGQKGQKGEEPGPAEAEKPMVTISTIHAAKGLEWPVVFIPAAHEGSLPHSRTDDMDEERRLLYVAMTRAKCLLNLSFALYGLCYRKDEAPKKQELSRFLEPIEAVCFVEQGPSYNRGLLEEMGDILRRPVPSDKDIFAGMRPGLALEDDQFPIDPETGIHGYYGDGDSDGEEDGRSRQQRQAKRRKLVDTPVYGAGDGGGGGGGLWQRGRGYATTMEGASTAFTVASLPGFMTASSHQRALQEAEAAEAETKTAATDEGLNWVKTTKGWRPAPQGQKTIQESFFGKKAGSTTGQGRGLMGGGGGKASVRPLVTATASTMQQRAAGWRQQEERQGIPPELKKRKLGVVRANALPLGKTTPLSAKTGKTDERPAAATTRYAHFSSPPKADAKPEQEQPFRPGKENQPLPPAAGKTSTGGHPWVPRPGTAPRPAVSFHRTTYAQVAYGGNGTGGPGRRTPANVLSKAFKPPSRV